MIVLYTILALIVGTTFAYVIRTITGTVWVETEPSFVPSKEAQKIPETDGLGDSK